MPFKSFKTKAEIPAEQQAGAIELKDGSFVVEEAADDTALQSALEKERTRADAAEKLSKKVAEDLKALERKQKAEKHGLTDDQLKEIRAEASKEAEERAAKLEGELTAERTSNRQKDIEREFKSIAAEKGKFLGTRLGDVFSLHGAEFDLTDDRKLMVKGKPGVDPIKHIESIAKARPEWVQGTQAGGGGAAGITLGGAPAVGMSVDAILANPEAGMAAARATGATQ